MRSADLTLNKIPNFEPIFIYLKVKTANEMGTGENVMSSRDWVHQNKYLNTQVSLLSTEIQTFLKSRISSILFLNEEKSLNKVGEVIENWKKQVKTKISSSRIN